MTLKDFRLCIALVLPQQNVQKRQSNHIETCNHLIQNSPDNVEPLCAKHDLAVGLGLKCQIADRAYDCLKSGHNLEFLLTQHVLLAYALSLRIQIDLQRKAQVQHLLEHVLHPTDLRVVVQANADHSGTKGHVALVVFIGRCALAFLENKYLLIILRNLTRRFSHGEKSSTTILFLVRTCLPGRCMVGHEEVGNMHVICTIAPCKQTSCGNRCVGCVLRVAVYVLPTDARLPQDNPCRPHTCFGAMPIWHGQTKSQLLANPTDRINEVHGCTKELFDYGVPAIVVHNQPCNDCLHCC